MYCTLEAPWLLPYGSQYFYHGGVCTVGSCECVLVVQGPGVSLNPGVLAAGFKRAMRGLGSPQGAECCLMVVRAGVLSTARFCRANPNDGTTRIEPLNP